jgi:ribonucleotide monophosphatase NagD (HAD superfamily)
MHKLILSTLPQTWLIDIDGTIFTHNGYLQGGDQLHESAKIFLESLPETDTIILLTSRTAQYREITERALQRCNIRYHQIIFDLPAGERILINDRKPRGLDTALAINVERDRFPVINVSRDDTI